MNVTNEEHVIIIIRFKISTYLFFAFTNLKASDRTRSYNLGELKQKMGFQNCDYFRTPTYLIRHQRGRRIQL